MEAVADQVSIPVPSVVTPPPRFIILPDSRWFRIWECIVASFIVYNFGMLSFEWAFKHNPSPPFVDFLVYFLFFCDIILTFFVAYINDGHLVVCTLWKIARKYACSWMIIDILSTFPPLYTHTHFMIDMLQSHGLSFLSYDTFQIIQPLGFLNLISLLRLLKVHDLFVRLEKDAGWSYSWVRCLKIVLVTIFGGHIWGCMFYLMAASNNQLDKTWIGLLGSDFIKKNMWTRYITSLYFSITTLTTVGYGDLHPVSPTEMFLGTCFMFLNLGLMTYVGGNINNLFSAGSKTQRYREATSAVSVFSEKNNLNPATTKQLLAYLSVKFGTNHEGQQLDLDSFPKALRARTLDDLFHDKVKRVALFSDLSDSFIFRLVSMMKMETYPPNVEVMSENESATHFYIIAKGAVDLSVFGAGVNRIIFDTRRDISVTGKTGVIGVTGVIFSRPQSYTVRTKELCQLLLVKRDAFFDLLMEDIVDIGDEIVNKLFKTLREPSTVDHLKQHFLDLERLVKAGSIILPVSLCFAAHEGYDLMLIQMLRMGWNPNECNKDKDSPLHIVALKGKVNLANRLLRHGANDKCTNADGMTPKELYDHLHHQ